MRHEPILQVPPSDLYSNYQQIFRFRNGWGASVVQGPYSYGGPEGKYELAVIGFLSEGAQDFYLNYKTPITNDVVGWLDESDVDELLDEISALPRWSVEDHRAELELQKVQREENLAMVRAYLEEHEEAR